jgi:hypothetical protein
MPAPDPWTAFLDWLTTVIVPDWTELVSMLPFFLALGVVGPILSLIMLMWTRHLFKRRRSHVQLAIPDVVAAPRDVRGEPAFPANAPFCQEHTLIYPPSRVTCEVDGANLSVRCPVDGTVRPASLQTCSACGTRYLLGASKAPALVQRTGRPPEGGAAVA